MAFDGVDRPERRRAPSAGRARRRADRRPRRPVGPRLIGAAVVDDAGGCTERARWRRCWPTRPTTCSSSTAARSCRSPSSSGGRRPPRRVIDPPDGLLRPRPEATRACSARVVQRAYDPGGGPQTSPRPDRLRRRHVVNRRAVAGGRPRRSLTTAAAPAATGQDLAGQRGCGRCSSGRARRAHGPAGRAAATASEVGRRRLGERSGTTVGDRFDLVGAGPGAGTGSTRACGGPPAADDLLRRRAAGGPVWNLAPRARRPRPCSTPSTWGYAPELARRGCCPRREVAEARSPGSTEVGAFGAPGDSARRAARAAAGSARTARSGSTAGRGAPTAALLGSRRAHGQRLAWQPPAGWRTASAVDRPVGRAERAA